MVWLYCVALYYIYTCNIICQVCQVYFALCSIQNFGSADQNLNCSYHHGPKQTFRKLHNAFAILRDIAFSNIHVVEKLYKLDHVSNWPCLFPSSPAGGRLQPQPYRCWRCPYWSLRWYERSQTAWSCVTSPTLHRTRRYQPEIKRSKCNIITVIVLLRISRRFQYWFQIGNPAIFYGNNAISYNKTRSVCGSVCAWTPLPFMGQRAPNLAGRSGTVTEKNSWDIFPWQASFCHGNQKRGFLWTHREFCENECLFHKKWPYLP